MMLTYLDSSPSEHCFKRRQRFMFVGLVGIRGLAVKATPRRLPGKVVYDCQFFAPEDGRAVGHGQHACIDQTLE
jgi:hypothetical protein